MLGAGSIRRRAVSLRGVVGRAAPWVGQAGLRSVWLCARPRLELSARPAPLIRRAGLTVVSSGPRRASSGSSRAYWAAPSLRAFDGLDSGGFGRRHLRGLAASLRSVVLALSRCRSIRLVASAPSALSSLALGSRCGRRCAPRHPVRAMRLLGAGRSSECWVLFGLSLRLLPALGSCRAPVLLRVRADRALRLRLRLRPRLRLPPKGP